MKTLSKMSNSLWMTLLKALVLLLGLPVLYIGFLFMSEVIGFAIRLYPTLLSLRWLLIGLLGMSALLFVGVLAHLFWAIHLIQKSQFFTQASNQVLKRASILAFATSGIYVCFLPIFYIAAELDDAPGFVLIGIFFVALAFGLGLLLAVLVKIFKQALAYKEENEWVV